MEIIKLTNENIDLLSEKIGDMYKRMGCTKTETMRAKLILEEALIKYQNRFGADTEIYYKEYSVFSQHRFLVRIRTASFDPFSLEENPMAFMIQSIMDTFEGNMPTWKYHNLENEVVFSVRAKAKVNSIVKVCIACAVSIVLGILARTFIPADTLGSLVTDYVSPLSNAYAGLFCVMAVLLTFFAITLSIVHIGDLAVVSAIGGKIMRRFYFMSAGLVIVITLAVLPFYTISGGGNLSIAAKSIYDILVGFIPENIVSPFLNFNSIHIMIIGAMFGFSLLYMGQKGENLTKIFDECNLVSIYTNNFLNKFIGIFVAVKIFELITANQFSALSNAGRMVAMIVAGEIVLLVFYTFYVCIKTKIPLKNYLKAVMPTFLICLSSANFGAAFSTSVNGFSELDSFNDKTNLSFNIGSVVFRPACTIVFVFSSLAMAHSYGVEISVVFVVMAIILSLLLVAAVPNIPGVSVSVITLLYAQLGLPSEAVALMIAINAPLQFLTVAVDTYCLQAECVCLSKMKVKNET